MGKISQQTGLSFSQALGNGFRQTIGAIFAREKMKPEIMLSGHREETIIRASNCEGEYVIAAQDTTYYNYTGHKQMEGLGTIQGQIKGLMQHNIMLMSQKGKPLGIMGQKYWTREGGIDLKEEEKESEKWEQALALINQKAAQIKQKIVLVEDREADIFSFFKAQRENNVELLVRVYQPRRIELVETGLVKSLAAIPAQLRDYGVKTVSIRRENREVELTLRLKAGKVNVYPRKDLSAKKHKTQGLSLVVAEEIACVDAKNGEPLVSDTKPAQWWLLTSLSAENLAQVNTVVDFYALRWRVERLHYTLKSGALNVEKLQFDDVHTLVNALSFYSVVAWQLLTLTYTLRENPSQSANQVFTSNELTLLQALAKKTISTVGDVVLALGKIVGFAPSSKQPFPGIKVLAQALDRFFFIKMGATASLI